jgi:hypothetical protein
MSAESISSIFFSTIGMILFECPKRLILHLSALNDKFKESYSGAKNRTDQLRIFSLISNLDESASLEGNANRKRRLIFGFENTKGEIINVCCEPHLKLPFNDDYPGDQSYSTNRRIYFHEGRADIANGRILIGHIGNHL